MAIGVYFTFAISALSALGFHVWFGGVHPNFGWGVLGYTFGSIFSAFAFKLNVDHQLAFEYEVAVAAEGLSFTVNTFLQALLIGWLDLDPVIAFGIANASSNLAKALVFLYYSCRANRGYQCEIGLALKTTHENGRDVYLLEGTLAFAANLAFNTLLVDFFDQLYFIIFVPDQRVIGELSLIRSFGNLMIRFLYGPVGDVTYNLYAKMFADLKLSGSNPGLQSQLASKLASILESCLALFAFLNYFVFLYSFGTASYFLRLCFGPAWASEVQFL